MVCLPIIEPRLALPAIIELQIGEVARETMVEATGEVVSELLQAHMK